MKKVKEVMEAYRDGDFETRLHMFLEHRSLRDEFMEMERPVGKSGADNRGDTSAVRNF